MLHPSGDLGQGERERDDKVYNRCTCTCKREGEEGGRERERERERGREGEREGGREGGKREREGGRLTGLLMIDSSIKYKRQPNFSSSL